MGDRANVVVRNGADDPGVWLYTHWNGSELPEMLAAALSRHQRWKDAAYLARIIFCQMIKGQESEETGFGISTKACDGEDRILLVDTDSETVSKARLHPNGTDFIVEKTWTFKQFSKGNHIAW